MSSVRIYIFQIIVIFLLLEAILHLIGFMDTYSEKIGNGYNSYYGQKIDSWYHSWTPNTLIDYKQPEFHYKNQYNNLGFRDINWVSEKEDSKNRLIILGDSFTEGDGAVRDSAFPSHLVNILNNDHKQWEVYNGGVCGNDPVYNYKFFSTLIMPKYEYDNIMFLINSSDLDDYVYRGGLERFLPDSTSIYKKGPWIEKIYKYSRLSRVIFHILGYNNLLLKNDEYEKLKQSSIDTFAKLYELMYRDNIELKKKMLVVIHIIPSELSIKDCSSLTVSKLALELDSKKVPYIYICDAMKKAYKDLPYEFHSWPINGHFNGKGYKIFSDVIYQETIKKYPDFFK